METEIEKSKAFSTLLIGEYEKNSVVITSILKKPTGNINIVSVDTGQGLTETTSPFDTFVQIIEGKVEIVISGDSNFLQTGQSIVIPAHAPIFVKPDGRFKMITIVLKSGYESC